MRSQCPSCNTFYNLKDGNSGKKTQCRKCGATFVVEEVVNCEVAEEAASQAAVTQKQPDEIKEELKISTSSHLNSDSLVRDNPLTEKLKIVKINKLERIALSSGIIGALTTNPRRTLAKTIEQHNSEGWNCRQILPHSTNNLFMVILQFLVMVCTLGLWTFGAGYLVLFEKRTIDNTIE